MPALCQGTIALHLSTRALEALNLYVQKHGSAAVCAGNGAVGDDPLPEARQKDSGAALGTDSLQQKAAGAALGIESQPGFSAADLVAQLSQSGTSAQMLLDALAALPKVGAVLEKSKSCMRQLQGDFSG